LRLGPNCRGQDRDRDQYFAPRPTDAEIWACRSNSRSRTVLALRPIRSLIRSDPTLRSDPIRSELWSRDRVCDRERDIGATTAEKLEGTSRGVDADRPTPFLFFACSFSVSLYRSSHSPSRYSSLLLPINSARRSGEALSASNSAQRKMAASCTSWRGPNTLGPRDLHGSHRAIARMHRGRNFGLIDQSGVGSLTDLQCRPTRSRIGLLYMRLRQYG